MRDVARKTRTLKTEGCGTRPAAQLGQFAPVFSANFHEEEKFVSWVEQNRSNASHCDALLHRVSTVTLTFNL